MNQYEVEARNLLSKPIIEALGNGSNIDLVKIIAATKGWNPLVLGEKMTVHYGTCEYVIHRTQ